MPRLENDRHERFAVKYVELGGNATEAAKQAGYSAATAYSQGGRLLRHVEVASRIAELRDEAFRMLHMTKDEVLALVAKRARASLRPVLHVTTAGDPYIDLNRADEDMLDVIESAEIEDFMSGRGDDAREVRRVKIKLVDRTKNVELLMKQMGLLRDQVEVTVSDDLAALLDAADKRAGGGGEGS